MDRPVRDGEEVDQVDELVVELDPHVFGAHGQLDVVDDAVTHEPVEPLDAVQVRA